MLVLNNNKVASAVENTEKIAILQKLIQIKSVNGNEAAVARYIASLFAPYGHQAKVEVITYAPGRDNLVVTIGDPEGQQLGFSGHEDVVAPAISAPGTMIHLRVRSLTVICMAAGLGYEIRAGGGRDRHAGVTGDNIALKGSPVC